jgi:hypothetical protein
MTIIIFLLNFNLFKKNISISNFLLTDRPIRLRSILDNPGLRKQFGNMKLFIKIFFEDYTRSFMKFFRMRFHSSEDLHKISFKDLLKILEENKL